MGKTKDLTGLKFGALTVISKSEKRDIGGNVYWTCKCDCGKEVIVRGHNLTSGHTNSCRCHSNKRKSKYPRQGKIYNIWHCMKNRCEKQNDKRFKNYGGRGIKICKEWQNYDNFHEWAINTGYEEGLTIERKDINGNYEPDNCTWINKEQQADNTTRSVYYMFQGQERTIRQISNITGLTYGCILHRIQRKQPVNGRILIRCN